MATSRASGCRRSGCSTISCRVTGRATATTRTPGSGGRTVVTTARRPDRVPRFTRAELLAHRATALLVAALALTGAALYYEPLVLLVGRRPLVEGLHIAAGLVLPLPTLVALWRSRGMRADLRALGRLTAVDREWLRRRDRRRAGLAVGKFNGGQKLAAATMVGAGLVLLATGGLLLARCVSTFRTAYAKARPSPTTCPGSAPSCCSAATSGWPRDTRGHGWRYAPEWWTAHTPNASIRSGQPR